MGNNELGVNSIFKNIQKQLYLATKNRVVIEPIFLLLTNEKKHSCPCLKPIYP